MHHTIPTIKQYGGEEVIGPGVFKLGTRRKSSRACPGCLTAKERDAQYPLNRKKGGLQSHSGYFGEEKISVLSKCPFIWKTV